MLDKRRELDEQAARERDLSDRERTLQRQRQNKTTLQAWREREDGERREHLATATAAGASDTTPLSAADIGTTTSCCRC